MASADPVKGTVRSRRITKVKYLEEFSVLMPQSYVAAQILSYIWSDKRLNFEDKLRIQEGLFSMQRIYPWGFEELCFNLEHSSGEEKHPLGRNLYATLRRSLQQEYSYTITQLKTTRTPTTPPQLPDDTHFQKCLQAVETLAKHEHLLSTLRRLYTSDSSMRETVVREYFENICTDLEKFYQNGATSNTMYGEVPGLKLATAVLHISKHILNTDDTSSSRKQLRETFCKEIYSNAENITYNKLIQFSEMCVEYNPDWAVAMFDWT